MSHVIVVVERNLRSVVLINHKEIGNMKHSKARKAEKRKLNNEFALKGRTKIQRKNNMMRAALNTFAGEAVGENLQAKYIDMHHQIAEERARIRRIEEANRLAEAKKKKDKENSK